MTDEPGRPSRVVFASAVVTILLASATTEVAVAYFTKTASEAGNTFQTGQVMLSDNDTGSALLAMTNAIPSDPPAVGCVKVTYAGTVPGRVRMYASVGGNGLDGYVDLKIERGTLSGGTYPSCAGFTPDAATYAGANGVVYSGTLTAFASAYTSYASGLTDPTASTPEVWTANETHAYRITATLQNNPAAKGLTATPTLSWEIQNS